MKRLAVLSVALCDRRTTLMKTVQESGERVRPYVARLRGLANVCRWHKAGPCTADGCTGTVTVDYTEERTLSNWPFGTGWQMMTSGAKSWALSGLMTLRSLTQSRL